jgi:fluoride ion exporter CrcB/FEX
MWKSVIAISFGAALGALLRWVLGTKLNSLPTVPPRTLAANLIGGYATMRPMGSISESTWAKLPARPCFTCTCI